MVIGVLGGSFCPPTKAHVDLSNLCVEKGLCDKVIWVPVNDAYKKSTNIASKHRIEMVKLALENEPNIEYSLHEMEFDTTVYTIDSLKMLKAKFPNDKIVFIAGADKMTYKWFRREEMVRDFGYIVTNRGDINCEEMIAQSENLTKWKENIKILPYESNISSTIARGEIKEHGFTNVVPEKVMKYIEQENLFRK